MRKLIRLFFKLLVVLFLLSVFYLGRKLMNVDGNEMNPSELELQEKLDHALNQFEGKGYVKGEKVNEMGVVDRFDFKKDHGAKDIEDGAVHKFKNVNFDVNFHENEGEKDPNSIKDADDFEIYDEENVSQTKENEDKLVNDKGDIVKVHEQADYLQREEKGDNLQEEEQGDNFDIAKYKGVTFPPYVEERSEKGLGENGKAVSLQLSPEEQEESDRLERLNSFNQYLSDRISVHRGLHDTRHHLCKEKTYPGDLPSASVIICFHNEAWSVLLRSVNSILDRSPPQLLGEVILVDDFSDMEHLKAPLELYMSRYPKVKIVRAERREGLIRARLLGYDAATEPVLVFLDSHIECFPGWLEPLVARISEEPKAVVFPRIPSIGATSFLLKPSLTFSVGVFRWDGLTFTWQGTSGHPSETEPLRSPTMPGGLFAIDKAWFTTLGTYDREMDYWGGENIELSFKTWMCNGTLEVIPCSHIGHIFRKTNPIRWATSGASARNSMRVAEVWMDDYKNLVYDYSFDPSNFGDVSERKKLRESLHCKSFDWYVQNIDTRQLPPSPVAVGEVRTYTKNLCLDSMGEKGPPGLFGCHGMGGSQRFVYTAGKTIQHGPTRKLVYDGKNITLGGSALDNTWDLDYEVGRVIHVRSGKCLTFVPPTGMSMEDCSGTVLQRWTLPRRKG